MSYPTMKYTYVKVYRSDISPTANFIGHIEDIIVQRLADLAWIYDNFGPNVSRWGYRNFISSMQECAEWSFAREEDLVFFKLARGV